MGDFNTQIGSRQHNEDRVLGTYYYRIRNERGDKLVEFCSENDLTKKRGKKAGIGFSKSGM